MGNNNVAFFYSGNTQMPYPYALYICWQGGNASNAGILALNNNKRIYYKSRSSNGWSDWQTVI